MKRSTLDVTAEPYLRYATVQQFVAATGILLNRLKRTLAPYVLTTLHPGRGATCLLSRNDVFRLLVVDQLHQAGVSAIKITELIKDRRLVSPLYGFIVFNGTRARFCQSDAMLHVATDSFGKGALAITVISLNQAHAREREVFGYADMYKALARGKKKGVKYGAGLGISA